MEECDGGRRRCSADAAERPGFIFAEVLLIHILGRRSKILAEWYISRAPCRGALIFDSKLIHGAGDRRRVCARTTETEKE